MFGIGGAKPRWMQGHSWEILCLSIGSGLVATEQIYSLLHTRVTQGSVHGASFLHYPLPAILVYVTVGLYLLEAKERFSR